MVIGEVEDEAKTTRALDRVPIVEDAPGIESLDAIAKPFDPMTISDEVGRIRDTRGV